MAALAGDVLKKKRASAMMMNSGINHRLAVERT
jgi:hypothetical protein